MNQEREALSKSELLDEVTRRTAADRREVEHVWENAVAVIQDAIKGGQDVSIAGFPKFSQRVDHVRPSPGPVESGSVHVHVTSLSDEERRFLANRHPDIGAADAVAVAVGSSQVLSAVLHLANYAEERSQSIQSLIEALTPEHEVTSQAALLQMRRNAMARAELAAEFGLFTSAEVAERSGSKARNKAAIANRWKQEGLIFSVPVGASPRFPGFQFHDEGRPLKVIAELIRILGPRLSDWDTALWFTSANGWLAGQRPADMVRVDPDGLIAAAENQMANERAF